MIYVFYIFNAHMGKKGENIFFNGSTIPSSSEQQMLFAFFLSLLNKF